MTSDERLCSQGHVIDPGRETCSRCNGLPVSLADGTPLNQPVETEVQETQTSEAPVKTKAEIKAEAKAQKEADKQVAKDAKAQAKAQAKADKEAKKASKKKKK